MKLADRNTAHVQEIGIILCCFPKCTIIVFYCLGHPSNTISSGALKFKVIYEPLEHCDFVDPQCRSWRSPYQTQNNIDYLQIKICQNQLSKEQEYFCPKCMCPI